MAKTYRKIQQWDRWLGQSPGSRLLSAEKDCLPPLLASFIGNQALLIGTPRQHVLLQAAPISNRYLFTPLLTHSHHGNIRTIESEWSELPVASGSIDVVVLPHLLELVDNPRQLLSEACRIVKPEGHIVILGFNPYSLWGIKKIWAKRGTTPWPGNFIKSSAIKQWLSYADFKLVQQKNLLFCPPVFGAGLNQFNFIEWLGRKSHLPWGGVYVLVAQAKVIPLTPIKLRWQQKLSDVKLTAMGIPKPTVRNHF